MFRMFKKGDNRSSKAVSPEGEKISKSIPENIEGKLKHALELTAYVMENDLNLKQHILTFVATENNDVDKSPGNIIKSVDVAFIRANSETLSEILLYVAMKNETFAKALITVSQAVQFHKPEMKEFSDDLIDKVEEAQREGLIPKKSGISTNGIRNLNSENIKNTLKEISIDDLSNASDKEIDDIVNKMLGNSDDE